MKSERLLTLGIVALLAAAALAFYWGFLPLGRMASAVIGVSANLQVPPLDDPAMVRRGAAHYEIVCAGCHASPLAPNRAEHLRLTPPAPKLHLRRDDWVPERLFLTVKHGIRNTAMPAWPAIGRDDEVWSVVAFLLVLPDLDAAGYRALSGLTVPSSPETAGVCARCHGADGRGDPTGAFPRLDIQTSEYLMSSLQAYRDGQRQSGFMSGIAGALTAEDLARLARHFSAKATPAPMPAAPDGPMARHLPDCTVCHGPPDSARADFPRLSGQFASYLAIQLRLFAQDPFTRGGGPFVGLMQKVGHDLTEADIRAAADRYGIPPPDVAAVQAPD